MLTKEQKVAVARDVIKQLGKGIYNAEQGVYTIVNYDLMPKGKDFSDNSQKYCKAIKECDVCARGAMFISSVKKFNHFEFGDWIADSNVLEKTAKDWGAKQALLIESAFELQDMRDTGFEFSDKLKDKAVQFGEQYPHDDERLIAICKNIIKNQGTFKP